MNRRFLGIVVYLSCAVILIPMKFSLMWASLVLMFVYSCYSDFRWGRCNLTVCKVGLVLGLLRLLMQREWIDAVISIVIFILLLWVHNIGDEPQIGGADVLVLPMYMTMFSDKYQFMYITLCIGLAISLLIAKIQKKETSRLLVALPMCGILEIITIGSLMYA